FASHAAPVFALAVSNRGEFLVTASADGTARRWNATRGEPLVYAARLLDESKQAWFARVSPDGKTLITGGGDRGVCVGGGRRGGVHLLTRSVGLHLFGGRITRRDDPDHGAPGGRHPHLGPEVRQADQKDRRPRPPRLVAGVQPGRDATRLRRRELGRPGFG